MGAGLYLHGRSVGRGRSGEGSSPWVHYRLSVPAPTQTRSLSPVIIPGLPARSPPSAREPLERSRCPARRFPFSGGGLAPLPAPPLRPLPALTVPAAPRWKGAASSCAQARAVAAPRSAPRAAGSAGAASGTGTWGGRAPSRAPAPGRPWGRAVRGGGGAGRVAARSSQRRSRGEHAPQPAARRHSGVREPAGPGPQRLAPHPPDAHRLPGAWSVRLPSALSPAAAAPGKGRRLGGRARMVLERLGGAPTLQD